MTAPVATAAAPAVATTTAVRLLAGRTLRQFLRNPPLVLGSFVMPVLMMFVMLAIFGPLIARRTGLPFLDRIGPLTILLTITFSMGTTAAGYFDDVHSGLLRRLRTMPVTGMSLLAGRVIADLIRILAIAGLTLLVAVLAGLRIQGPLGLLGFVAVVALYACLFTALALCVAARARTQAAAMNALNLPAVLLLFLSSGYVPVSAFPDVLQPVVRVSPLTSGVEAMIGFSQGGPLVGPLLGVLAWTVGGTALLLADAVSRLPAASRHHLDWLASQGGAVGERHGRPSRTIRR